MATRRIDDNGDWTFGQGTANYLIGAPEVLQNVITRIKSFQNDWYLDTKQCIDWFNILANRNNQKIIEDEVSNVVFTTAGVRKVYEVKILNITKRDANIYVKFDTIYNVPFEQEIGIPLPSASTSLSKKIGIST